MSPYVGGSLVSLFDEEPQAATNLAMRRMAERGGDRMVDLTVQNTPIDKGNLRSSWYQIPTHKTHFAVWDAYESGVATEVHYAPHVEHGTGLWGPKHAKYPITAKAGGFLRWIDPASGKEVFAKKVMHPGSPGQHMIAIAAEVTEHEVDTGVLFNGILHDWVTAVEASAD
jgi:hypothetical protein